MYEKWTKVLYNWEKKFNHPRSNHIHEKLRIHLIDVPFDVLLLLQQLPDGQEKALSSSELSQGAADEEGCQLVSRLALFEVE